MKNFKRSFRFVCTDAQKPLVAELLRIQGFTWEEENFAKNACRLIEEPVSLGLSLASFFGFIYIQDRASMLPPVALNPPQGAFILDMCASPGSKTGQLASMIGEYGFVIGNEPSPSRLATLRRNLQQMNATNAASCCYNGQNIPLPSEFFDFIQLDPPCSGWGTIERNPKVMEMWKEDKTQPLIKLQQQLLQEAYRLLKPNGVLVYSTCTTNEEENEKQVLYAKELGFIVDNLPELPEFIMDKPLYNVGAVWRLSPRLGDTQGFFVARLIKQDKNPTNQCYSINKQQESSQKPLLQNNKTLDFQDNRNFNEYHLEDQKHSYMPLEEMIWGNPLTRSHFNECRLNKNVLEHGDVSIFGESLHFIHNKAKLFPSDFLWQGMYMGKVSKHGDIALSPRLRMDAKLPQIHFTGEHGIAQIKGLLSGQSIPIKDIIHQKEDSISDISDTRTQFLYNENDFKNAKNALFYWNGLLLGRLKIKNSRCIWTER